MKTIRRELRSSMVRPLVSAIALASTSMLMGSGVMAQDAQTLPPGTTSPGAATLRDVVEQTINTNPEVLAAWNGFQAAGHDERVAFGGYLPQIDVNAGVGLEDRQNDQQGSYDTDYVEVTLNQMIYDGFATASEVERLSRAELVRYYELLGASQDAALDATNAYLDVQRYRRLVGLAQDNYQKHLEVYQQIEARALSGAGRRVDLEQISGRLALAESNLITEASNLHDVSARFQRLVGELPPEALAPAPTFAEQLPADVAQALQLAYEGNPDFHAAIENIEAARAEREGTKSPFHPRLDLVGRSGTYKGSDTDGDFISDNDHEDRHSIELVGSLNLYRGGSDLASFRAASDRVEQAVNLRDKACVDIRQTTTIAYNDTRRLRDQLEYLNEHRQTTDRVRGAYKQQFDIGQRSLLDLLDIENEYFEASRAYVNAQYDVALADARTLRATGSLLEVLEVRKDGLPSLAELDSNGVSITPDIVCPAVGPRSYSIEELTGSTRAPDVVMPADALFEINSYVLSASAKQELSALADRIRGRNDLVRVFIAGHADISGTDAINDPLSRNRAAAVGQYLVSQGVSASLIETRGYGSHRPVQSNDTVEGRRQNRRVEITLERSGENLDMGALPGSAGDDSVSLAWARGEHGRGLEG
ncbi:MULTISPECIES: TolC family outer membrane protein [unclassified Halomonas]|uniref:TolC family outer membrane protein n=1 Tax=unclassified Halomonas TaxID=2609666 RepID=UPI000A46501D|nr:MULTISPECIES: TolC family outer membrane protein [unclassified Halomonas]